MLPLRDDRVAGGVEGDAPRELFSQRERRAGGVAARPAGHRDEGGFIFAQGHFTIPVRRLSLSTPDRVLPRLSDGRSGTPVAARDHPSRNTAATATQPRSPGRSVAPPGG